MWDWIASLLGGSSQTEGQRQQAAQAAQLQQSNPAQAQNPPQNPGQAQGLWDGLGEQGQQQVLGMLLNQPKQQQQQFQFQPQWYGF